MEQSKHCCEQFLTFELHGESYGIEILKVLEIRVWEPLRRIPKAPAFIKGALNLRGIIVPVIDLRERFGMDEVEYSPFTVVIVVNVKPANDSQPIVMGMVADAVSDVLDLEISEIKKAPNLGSKIDTRFIRGVYAGDEGLLLLIDAEKLLNPEEFEDISKIN